MKFKSADVGAQGTHFVNCKVLSTDGETSVVEYRNKEGDTVSQTVHNIALFEESAEELQRQDKWWSTPASVEPFDVKRILEKFTGPRG